MIPKDPLQYRTYQPISYKFIDFWRPWHLGSLIEKIGKTFQWWWVSFKLEPVPVRCSNPGNIFIQPLILIMRTMLHFCLLLADWDKVVMTWMLWYCGCVVVKTFLRLCCDAISSEIVMFMFEVCWDDCVWLNAFVDVLFATL